MPRYLIERTLDYNLTISVNDSEEENLSFINNNHECNAIWLHSYLSDDSRKLFCIYDAPTPEAIRKAAQKNNLPIDKIIEVKILDPYSINNQALLIKLTNNS
ncbi:MAG: DUF4242 domain-containing protein [Ignavibacteriales bacterium]|nr:MAG: DUF4242 domain-containing protein [Ignavibacteriales bacterium]